MFHIFLAKPLLVFTLLVQTKDFSLLTEIKGTHVTRYVRTYVTNVKRHAPTKDQRVLAQKYLLKVVELYSYTKILIFQRLYNIQYKQDAVKQVHRGRP